MAARLSRGLPQVNRRVLAGLSSRARPRVANTIARAGMLAHRDTLNIEPSPYRPTSANIARYAHTDASSSGERITSIIDATGYKGSSITEKHWTSQDVPVVAPLIEPSAVLHFVEFITTGILPNGKKTDLPLLSPDEFPLFMTPTSQWAPAPFNKETLPTIEKAMMRMTRPEGMTGLCQIGHNIHSLKSRLWAGLPPMSASRWREKDLSNPEHFTIAHEYLTSVIAVFEYLNISQVQANMCATFNKVSGDFGEMQNALNTWRKAQGSGSPELNLIALWEEFIRAQYQVMTSTAHSWIMARLAELQEATMDGFCAATAGTPGAPEMEVVSQRWSDLISVTSMADFNIWISMDGYNGYKPPSEIVAGLHNPDLKKLDQNHGFSQVLMDRLAKCIEAQNEAAEIHGPSATESEAARRERLSISTVVQDELREKIRGRTPSPQPPVQPWIQQLLRAHEAGKHAVEKHGYGFGVAIYRSVDKLSDEQWESLKRDVEEHFSAWGDHLQGGADELKPLLKLHWFDCKELGFDSVDRVAEARRHYQQIRSSDEWNYQIAPPVFLLLDHIAFGSYTDKDWRATFTSDKGLLAGDFQGHVLAVDATFDNSTTTNETADGTDKPDTQFESPEYSGQMRILGNLVWSELFPMLMLQSVPLENIWPLARDHPNKVYTGPTVPSQVEPWKERNAMKAWMMDGFVEFLKGKDPTLAGKVEGFRKKGML